MRDNYGVEKCEELSKFSPDAAALLPILVSASDVYTDKNIRCLSDKYERRRSCVSKTYFSL